MGDDGGGSSSCKTSPGFRCLCLARCALALLVTALAAVVVVRGLNLVLRPVLAIELNISQSDVFVRMYGEDYVFRFYLEATNPSGVLFIYYRNITVELLDVAAPQQPLATFDISPESLSLAQKEEQEFLVFGFADAESVSAAMQQKLFTGPGQFVEGAVMMLTGVMAIENVRHNDRAARYYGAVRFSCQPVVIRGPDTLLPRPSSANYRASCLPTVF